MQGGKAKAEIRKGRNYNEERVGMLGNVKHRLREARTRICYAILGSDDVSQLIPGFILSLG